MKFVSDNRASRILYNLLASNSFEKPFLAPANVCEVIPQVFNEANVRIDFWDIDNTQYCLDINHFLGDLNDYSGALFVHTYGVERGNEGLFKRIKDCFPSFVIIDDRCLCTPSVEEPSTSADVCLYSVGEKKQVDLGKGGLAYIQCGLNYKRCALVSDSFMDDSVWVYNSQTIIDKTNESIRHRELINTIYKSRLPHRVQLDNCFQNWRFNIYVDDKDAVLQALFNQGLFASSHYRPIVSYCRNANDLHNHIVNLFNDFHYNEEMAVETCKVINSVI